MFQSARIKLTARYLLIIMTVSLFFSLVIYSWVNTELKQIERVQLYYWSQSKSFSVPIEMLQNAGRGQVQRIIIPTGGDADLHAVEDARNRIVLILVIINLGILVFAGWAGYILAGQTLQPIQEMVEEQRRFLANASHELRTPLTALRTELEVNLRDKRLSLATARQLLTSNLEEVKQLQHLTSRLLRLLQAQHSTATTTAATSLQPAVAAALRKVEPLAKAKQLTITTALSPASTAGQVRLAEAELTEVLVILLDNAIKYTPAERTGTSITVTARQAAQKLRVSVQDLGQGIAAADVAHIFTRFYQADQARSHQHRQGYGLGLAIAKELITNAGGRIWVESQLGTGSTFTFELPLQPAQRQTPSVTT